MLISSTHDETRDKKPFLSFDSQVVISNMNCSPNMQDDMLVLK
jgi:hypothetical protein